MTHQPQLCLHGSVLLLSFIEAKAPFLPLWAETASAVAAVTWLICGHLRDVSAAELGYF